MVVTDRADREIFPAADTWAARSVVRVRDLTEDLPVEHVHEVVEGVGIELLAPRWPIPTDRRRRLLLRSRGDCAIEGLQLRQGDSWSGIVSPDSLPLRLPLEVLSGEGKDGRLRVELWDVCGRRMYTSIHAAP